MLVKATNMREKGLLPLVCVYIIIYNVLKVNVCVCG